ncbi:cytochrome c oxidase assembly protein [Fulvimarina sp. 2208YS6-2-32]|uniref:Cytochrome c oxidase assembly protein n=1 Tax=Fulvimarina uroteuthidis TaxID=3098149 RepID=A0ABU5I1S5_9HYPH|nr:cytochrome c oxidase assembly protein [Fulvimarina sp. 2208YS6-2-32]MDY8109092.1 cytochrome c oxidase assembly protein [Fulvimarina sp. 2208YS6-2-32]
MNRTSRLWPLVAGALILVAVWVGPLAVRAASSFAAHMIMHMAVVALAAPLLAVGLARAFPAATNRIPAGVAIVASFAEFAIVWGWHAPAPHDLARTDAFVFAVEQTSFLLAGLIVWLSALGAAGATQLRSRAAGVVALLVTSMHMTLLGALLLMSPRTLYACAEICSPLATMTPLADQQAGGVIMLIVGGSAYLVGGLACLASILNDTSARPA